MKKKFQIQIIFLALIVFFFNLSAILDFGSRNASFVLNKEDNSRIKFSNISSVNGWHQESIVKTFGSESIGISNGDVIGFEDGDVEVPTNLIYNNSNSIEKETRDFNFKRDTSNLSGQTSIGGGGVLLLDGIHTDAGSEITIDAKKAFIASPIDLAGSTLSLNGDFIFSSGTTIDSSGILDPSGNAFVLGADLTVPADTQISFISSGIFDGQGHRLIFRDNSRLKLDNHVSLTLRNITLENVGNTNNDSLTSLCMDNKDCRLTLQDAKLKLSRDYSFTLGRLYVQDDVLISGTNQFNYTSTQACFIAKNSTLKFDLGTTFSYGPSALFNDAKDLIVMTDETSQFYLNGATLKSTTTGLRLTKGTLTIDHKCAFYNQDDANGQATSVSQAITIGNGTYVDDLSINLMPGGSVALESGILVYQNAN